MVTKKSEEKNFPKNTRIWYPKYVGKKLSQKSEKTRFLLTNKYCDQKRGKKREKNFFQKHTYFASYKRWKKIVWKMCGNTFFINT